MAGTTNAGEGEADRSDFVLVTTTKGSPAHAPVILLHDRLGDIGSLASLTDALVESHLVVTVRGARTQMIDGRILGYYWYVATDTGGPEPSTFGDGLHQLELLLLTLDRESPGRNIHLVGFGQGGTMALTLGLVWPELVAGIVAVDAGLPDNLDRLPIESRALDGLDVLLVSTDDGADRGLAQRLEATGAELAALGGRVGTMQAAAADLDDRIARWIADRGQNPAG